MSETSKTKKCLGFYAAILSALLSAAAGIYFQSFGGIFGATKRVCYHPAIVGLLIGAAVVVAVLFALKRYGLASAACAAMPGIAFCVFVHECYWYISDVFVAIDEKGFDQKFIIFVALIAAAFVVGEIAVFAKKVKTIKA